MGVNQATTGCLKDFSLKKIRKFRDPVSASGKNANPVIPLSDQGKPPAKPDWRELGPQQTLFSCCLSGKPIKKKRKSKKGSKLWGRHLVTHFGGCLHRFLCRKIINITTINANDVTETCLET